jgi:hypothetical protein
LEITNPVNNEKSTQIKEDSEMQELNSKVTTVSFLPFDFKKPLYIEIHRGNIFHYFASGLITPSKYISNRAFPDLQSIQNDLNSITKKTKESENYKLCKSWISKYRK